MRLAVLRGAISECPHRHEVRQRQHPEERGLLHELRSDAGITVRFPHCGHLTDLPADVVADFSFLPQPLHGNDTDALVSRFSMAVVVFFMPRRITTTSNNAAINSTIAAP